MHDTDSSARTPALDSIAERPPFAGLLLVYEKEIEIAFKQEIYRVRDNGAVFRRAMPQARRRKLDEVWTFGTLNRHSGYFELNGDVVHRIVAWAFHGAAPSEEHVVDHIDTNRQNNRADNLRWVTRLDNILLNPITRARIELAYGSLEEFFANPGACSIPNWHWMRVVTKEQAEQCRKRLLAWAENGQAGKGGSLGEWLYRQTSQPFFSAGKEGAKIDAAQLMAAQWEALDVPTYINPVIKRDLRRPFAVVKRAALEPEPLDTPSLTASAFQRKWRTPTEYPQCPGAVFEGGLAGYQARLSKGIVFARNRHGDSIVERAAIAHDNKLSVMCYTPSGVKGWANAKVYVEGAAFCHESCGTFFSKEGATKAHCQAIGAPPDAYEDSIDDYC